MTNQEAREWTIEQQEVFEYLVKIRNSGVTNMWGAAPYVQRAFPYLTEAEAQRLHIDWIKTFGLPREQQPKDGRKME